MLGCEVIRLDNRILRDEPLPIDQAAAGDEEAFACIVQRMAPLIHAQVRSFYPLFGTEYEDLAQEALLGLLYAVRSYSEDGGASFATYATACIRHRLQSVARRNGSRAVQEQPLEEQDDLPALTGDPVQWVQQTEEANALLARLRQRLTPLEYKVMLLRLSDCSYADIAVRLSVSKKAVDNAVQRLRRKLANAFR